MANYQVFIAFTVLAFIAVCSASEERGKVDNENLQEAGSSGWAYRSSNNAAYPAAYSHASVSRPYGQGPAVVAAVSSSSSWPAYNSVYNPTYFGYPSYFPAAANNIIRQYLPTSYSYDVEGVAPYDGTYSQVYRSW